MGAGCGAGGCQSASDGTTYPRAQHPPTANPTTLARLSIPPPFPGTRRQSEDVQRLRRGLQGRTSFDTFDLARATTLEGVMCEVSWASLRASALACVRAGVRACVPAFHLPTATHLYPPTHPLTHPSPCTQGVALAGGRPEGEQALEGAPLPFIEEVQRFLAGVRATRRGELQATLVGGWWVGGWVVGGWVGGGCCVCVCGCSCVC